MAVTKQDILNDLQLVKKGLQEVEFYIRYYTEENIEKGVNGIIDYIGKILKEVSICSFSSFILLTLLISEPFGFSSSTL